MACQILLIDDDQLFREELKECLEEYEIIEAGSGEAGLHILKGAHEIDLVILDLILPGLKGTEVLPKIKKDHPDLPVILLTGYGSKEVVIKALREDADDYLEKPVKIEKLKELINFSLSRRQIARAKAKGEVENTITKVKHFIERNCYKKVSLQAAARSAALTPKYLSRVFKQQTGGGFKQYLQQVKTAEAKNLLHKTSLTVSEISAKLGYENPESFIRLFKRLAGLTPAVFRKKHAKNKSGRKI